MESVFDAVLDQVGHPILYPVAGLCVALSAIFPPVPSTSLFVALGALSASAGAPHAGLLILTMAVGSWVGDTVLWRLARNLNFQNWRLFRSKSAQLRLTHLTALVHSHTLVLTLLSRYIPLGRTSVALVAGASQIPAQGFGFAAGLSAAIWSLYSVGFGWLTARWIPLPTYLAVTIAIGVSLFLGWILSKYGDRLLTHFHHDS